MGHDRRSNPCSRPSVMSSKDRALQFALALSLVPVGADAQPALDLFIGQIEARARGDVCIARIPGFQSSFDPAYKSWMERHSAELAQGRALAEKRSMLGESGPNVQRFAQANAELLRGVPADDLRRRCDESLGGLQR